MPIIETYHIEHGLNLSANKEPYIIKHIMHISFPNLKHLNLSSNNIRSIEMLATVNVPVLESL